MARPSRPRLHALAAAAAVIVGVLCASTITAGPAGAHPIGQSTLELTGSGSGDGPISGVLTMPATRLDIVMGTHLAGDGVSTSGMKLTAADSRRVADYVERRVTIRSGSSASADLWDLVWSTPTLVDLDGLAQVQFRLTASPSSSGASSGSGDRASAVGSVSVTISAIVEEIRTHDVIVSTRASAKGAFELAGIADYASRSVDISAAIGSTTNGARAGDGSTASDGGTAFAALATSVRLGWGHLWSGADHVIFLVLLGLGLMVPAAGSARPSLRRTVRRVVIASVGFTIGHGVSLAAVSAGVLNPPSRVVETAIAVTIGLTAAALLSGRLGRIELILVPIFGLIHGLGFAGALTDAGVESHRLPTLLGFNLGLEAAQLVVLAALIPMAMLLTSTRPAVRRRTRTAAGILGMTMAAGWALERATGRANALASAVDTAFARPPLVVVGIALIPLCVLFVKKAIGSDRSRPRDASATA